MEQHPKGNKLRDVPEEYVQAGHCFSLGTYERELIYTFDVCSGCESHSIMYQLELAWNQIKEDARNLLQTGKRTIQGRKIQQWLEEMVEKTAFLSQWKEQETVILGQKFNLDEKRKNNVNFQFCPR